MLYGSPVHIRSTEVHASTLRQKQTAEFLIPGPGQHGELDLVHAVHRKVPVAKPLPAAAAFPDSPRHSRSPLPAHFHHLFAM